MNTQAPRLYALRLPLAKGCSLDPFAMVGEDELYFEVGGRVMVGHGNALTIAIPGGIASPADLRLASAAVASVESVGRTGHGPPGAAVHAFGSLPFEPGAPSSLTVPVLTYQREPSGQEFATVVGPDPARFPATPEAMRQLVFDSMSSGPGAPSARSDPRPLRVESLSTDDQFRSMVGEAVSAIRRGALAKVVLSRQVDVTMDAPVDRSTLLARWRRLEPECAVFSVPSEAGHLVGASPELLVARDGRAIHSRPLAGTTGRNAAVERQEGVRTLLDSEKDRREHRLVVEAISAVLGSACDELNVPAGPDLIHLHSITHLATSITGLLSTRADGTVASSLELVGLLHPTPAVGGVPSDEAQRMIADLEPVPRGSYAGPVGFLDGEGNGTWMLGIRSMVIAGASARLAAGVGVVDGSEPDAELAETNLKLSAAFDALAPGSVFSTDPVRSPRTAVG